MLAHTGVGNALATRLVVRIVQCQSLVVYKSARASELTHLARLLTVRHEFVFVGLDTLHGYIIFWSMHTDNDIRSETRPDNERRWLLQIAQRECRERQLREALAPKLIDGQLTITITVAEHEHLKAEIERLKKLARAQIYIDTNTPLS